MSTPGSETVVAPLGTVVVSIAVLFLGFWLSRRFRFLADNHIPPAVSGGLVCSAAVAAIHTFGGISIAFDMAVRDALLLCFFATVGLNAKLRMLAAGGRPLLVLIVLAGVFLVLQDLTGVLLAVAFDAHPAYGLFAGSVSLAGGHGTAIAWGAEAEAAGLAGAAPLGIAFATFGLVAGGLVGGPIAGRLIESHGLQSTEALHDEPRPARPAVTLLRLEDRLGALLAIALSVGLGASVNDLFSARGVVVPGFLTALLVGVLITNLADVAKLGINRQAVDIAGELSLALFLSMSLMSMQLWVLANSLGVITLVMMVQVLVITLFAMVVVFRLLGRTYDAAVITAGFAGLGLGATPVAIANMNAVTSRYGPSTQAFLVVPLVGAFFIDILNASVIKFFIGTITRLFGS